MKDNKSEELLLLLIHELKNVKDELIAFMSYERVSSVLLKRAVERSADYAEKNMSTAVVFSSNRRERFWECAISKLKVDGYLSEFGVFNGESINYLAKLVNPKTIFGFDSFKGLEEDFSVDYPRGGFNRNGVAPLVEQNVLLVEGSFSESLPNWLNENKGVFSFINIDCDTYESTSTVLNLIGPERIVPGTIIIFDEYFGFPGWENEEFKAWQEYCNKHKVKYRYVAICQMKVLVEIL